MPLVQYAEKPADQITSTDPIFAGGDKPTLEAETFAQFLLTVDYTPLFEDKGAQQLIVLVGKDIEQISGEDAASIIDEHDLLNLFRYYISEEHPSDGLENRMVLGCFEALMPEDDGKGNVKPITESQHNTFAPIMMAMLREGTIQRYIGDNIEEGKKMASVKWGGDVKKKAGGLPMNWVPPSKRHNKGTHGVNKQAGLIAHNLRKRGGEMKRKQGGAVKESTDDRGFALTESESGLASQVVKRMKPLPMPTVAK